MDIINAVESILKARMDEYAFKINSCIQNQHSEESIDKLLLLIAKYSKVSNEIGVLQNIKTQLSSFAQSQEAEPEMDTEDED